VGGAQAACARDTGLATVAVSTAIRNKLLIYFVDLDFAFMGFSFKNYLHNRHRAFDMAIVEWM
jgi:hypothetical protein